MNFLSHFYFDRDIDNCYHILGIVLPDLLKNADKTIVLHPEKLSHPDPEINSIIQGWKKHLEVDRYFHSSGFFLTHSHELKLLLTPAVGGSPVKPFFLGHIAIELILDNLLITADKISVNAFYENLERCEIGIINEFLTFAGLKDTTDFFAFYENFKKSQYLYSYAETKEIAYALKRICMRVWKDPFTPGNEAQMNRVLMAYRETLLDNFMSVFGEIEDKLNASAGLNKFIANGERHILRPAEKCLEVLPERHGCVTAWIVFALILNSICLVLYFLIANDFIRLPKISILTAYSYFIICLLNVIFSIRLLSWKKSAFYGFVITSIIAFLINLSIGMSTVGTILGLLGIGFLYGIFQIKKSGVSAWDHLK